MKRKTRSSCPISFSLDLFGDRWTLLVLRDMAMFGRRHYGDFLKAGEGIATNILADRLERLEQAGLILKARDPDDAKRTLYTLTERGLDTLPILLEMVAWGGRHDPDSPVSADFLERIRSDRDGLIAEHRDRLTAPPAAEEDR